MVLRTILLFLSRQWWLRNWMERSRLFRPLIRRFIAGRTLEDAVGVCRRLNQQGIWTTLDHLGENVSTPEEARRSVELAVEALQRLRAEQLPATLSIKLTQFGLDLSEGECRRNVFTLVEHARSADRRVEIDMESSAYTERTLALVLDLHAAFGNVRAVVQAYLHRTEKDVRRLCEQGIPVRLCKGAYLEPEEAAIPKKSEVDANYLRLMKILLAESVNPALATHDAAMIGKAIEFARSKGIAPDRFEFQMLYGIRRDLQNKLIGSGYRLRLYVPYGAAWYPYFMRRMAERPANLWFVVRTLART